MSAHAPLSSLRAAGEGAVIAGFCGMPLPIAMAFVDQRVAIGVGAYLVVGMFMGGTAILIAHLAGRRARRQTAPVDNAPLPALPPAPMPDVARARIYMPDAIQALERAGAAWNKTQMLDAIRSAETFIGAAKTALAEASASCQRQQQPIGIRKN